MEILAVVSGVAIAAGGWIVSQYQARRAVRRNMRVDYLLGAYRRLETSSNRAMTEQEDRDVETAIADIQLLGSPSQVALADEFARVFSLESRADTEPLLQDLRGSLRRELLLEKVPPKRVWLRISRDGGTMSERSLLWHDTRAGARLALNAELGGARSLEELDGEFSDQMRALAESASPMAAVEASTQCVEHTLRGMLVNSTGPESIRQLNVSQLANRALELGLIDSQAADSINGLGVMRMLAILDQTQLDVEKAMEFVSLASAMLYVLNSPSRARRSDRGPEDVMRTIPSGRKRSSIRVHSF